MRRFELLLIVALFLIFSVGTMSAQPVALTRQGSVVQQASSPITSYTLPPDKLAKSTALYVTETRLLVFELAYTFVVLLALLYGGVGRRFRDLAERVSNRRFVQAAVFGPLFLLVAKVLLLPIGLYGHRLSREYGLSVEGWGTWFGDWGKGALLEIVAGTLLVWLLYSIIHRSPRRWWFHFWLCTLPIIVFVVFISPIVIEPMFDKFEPLEKSNPQLVSAIEEVVQRGGMQIPPGRMYEMRASEKTTELNAYVTGFGSTKRVVVWDTTERAMTIPETLFVFGHEMGHYVLGHIWKGMAMSAGLLFVLFYFGSRLFVWIVNRWGGRWGIRQVGDWASVPVLLVLVFAINLAVSPLSSAVSRRIEHEADVYGLNIIQGIVPDPGQVAAHSFQVLGEKSLDYPHPDRLLVIWFYDHPTVADRLQFALHYEPHSR